MILLAGFLLLLPGFVTDAVGFLLFVPAFRDWMWRVLARRVLVKVDLAGMRAGGVYRRDSRTIDLDEDDFTRTKDGGQIGFSVAGGRVRGHVDGVVFGAPSLPALQVPALWECKTMNAKSWRETVAKGVVLAKPIYAVQIALYQAYLEPVVPGISEHPALFTAINKDTAELHHELVPFDAARAQAASDRAVRILRATDAHELLPRVAREPAHNECRFCSWSERCWRLPA